jgi:cell wall-associated NlpC family hydrolase
VPWAVTIDGPGGRRRRGAPRVGDVLVFSHPYHVGIYSGGGYVLHASSYFDEVVESELYYLKRDLVYLGARVYR